MREPFTASVEPFTQIILSVGGTNRLLRNTGLSSLYYVNEVTIRLSYLDHLQDGRDDWLSFDLAIGRINDLMDTMHLACSL